MVRREGRSRSEGGKGSLDRLASSPAVLSIDLQSALAGGRNPAHSLLTSGHSLGSSFPIPVSPPLALYA